MIGTSPLDHRGRPRFDQRALVFRVNGHEGVGDFVLASDTSGISRGLEDVRAYVAARRPDAKVRSLYAERAYKVSGEKGIQFALPDLSTKHGSMSSIHYLRLASADDGPRL